MARKLLIFIIPNMDIQSLSFVSFNMHGYNQRFCTVLDLNSPSLDVIFLQEHWLTPDKLIKLNDFPGYFAFGSSAMCHAVESGVLRGRPYGGVAMCHAVESGVLRGWSYGGVAILVKDSPRHLMTTVIADERYCIVMIDKLFICNVYLPYSGTADGLDSCNDVLVNIGLYRERSPIMSALWGKILTVSLAVVINSIIELMNLCPNRT